MIVTKIADLLCHQGQHVSFRGQLIGISKLISQHGKPYYRLILEADGQQCLCHVWPEVSFLFGHMGMLDLKAWPTLEIVGRMQALDNKLMCSVSEISLVDNAMPTMAIPLRASQAHCDLWGYVKNLPLKPLKRFMLSVLNDPAIYPGFVYSRASESSHHAFPGGLLVHSVQVGRLVDLMGREFALNETELHLSIVGGLLHDIGKVQTVGAANPRPMPPKLFRHEVRSIFLLAPHLEELRSEWPEGAWVLEHLLDRMITNPDKRGTLFIGQDLIHHADQASAANQCGKKLKDFMQEGRYAAWHPANQIAENQPEIAVTYSSEI